jgi:ribosomal protein L21E
MSQFIDSPFEICPVCDEYVFLDQSYRQCAREHHCGNMKCPLERFFVGSEVQISVDSAAERAGAEKQWAGNR